MPLKSPLQNDPCYWIHTKQVLVLLVTKPRIDKTVSVGWLHPNVWLRQATSRLACCLYVDAFVRHHLQVFTP